MLAILNSLNAHNLLIFQPTLMILVSKFMVYKALSDRANLSLGLLSPLSSSRKSDTIIDKPRILSRILSRFYSSFDNSILGPNRIFLALISAGIRRWC